MQTLGRERQLQVEVVHTATLRPHALPLFTTRRPREDAFSSAPPLPVPYYHSQVDG